MNFLEKKKNISDSKRVFFFDGKKKIILNRRQMLKLMGTSFILLTGAMISCRRPEIKIMPYTNNQKQIIPGISNYYASSYNLCNNSIGVLIKSNEGRPTKIEGNKMHPLSLGSSNIYIQSSILELYDPDRSKVVKKKNLNGSQENSNWNDWEKKFSEILSEFYLSNGKGLSFLFSDNLNSLSINKIKKLIKKNLFYSKWYHYISINNDSFKSNLLKIFDKNLNYILDLKKAKIILSINFDMFADPCLGLKNSHDFSLNRKIYDSKDCKKINRLYSVETCINLTSYLSDIRLLISYNEIENFLKLLSHELFINNNLSLPKEFLRNDKELFFDFIDIKNIEINNKEKVLNFIKNLSYDLLNNLGNSIIIPCNNISEKVNSLINLLNFSLLNFGNTIKFYKDTIFENEDHNSINSISALCNSIINKEVENLIIIGGNPVYDTPGSLKFKQICKNINNIIYMGTHENETSKIANWHIPLNHTYESWIDFFSLDGTVTLCQPVINPLHNTKAFIDIFLQLAKVNMSSLEYIKKCFYDEKIIFNENEWKKAIHDGIFLNKIFSEEINLNFNLKNFLEIISKINSFSKKNFNNIEILFNHSYSLLDGRYSNISWLQELPDPVTKLTWDNVALLSPELANKLGIKSFVSKQGYKSEIISLSYKDIKIETPTYIVPGINNYSLIVFLGYGRVNSGFIGDKIGIDFFPLLPEDGSFYIENINILKINKHCFLSCSQNQFSLNDSKLTDGNSLTLGNRSIIKSKTLEDYLVNFDNFKLSSLPSELLEHNIGDNYKKQPIQLTKPWKYKGNKWGMVIDLNLCNGCSACSIACQSENNIPTVGKIQVRKGRIMNWIRIDRYFLGSTSQPNIFNQPVLCMHCENAPCEPVCPVAATVHDHEGLNTMVYNRCIGTRYCANNCPYKVRRFNYLDFTNSGNLYVEEKFKKREEILKLQKNPEVTIRYRGVMEKCTFCTQRIQEVKFKLKREGLDYNNIKDDDIETACSQACPTRAISFGNLNHSKSKVLLLKLLDRNYELLEELNIRPRVSYLIKIQNVNMRIK